MSRVARIVAVVAGLVVVHGAQARLFFFEVPLSGAQEVAPNVGDPDGSGIARLTIDDSTNPPRISWNIETHGIILPPTGAHIHIGAAGTNGPVRVDFSSQLSGSNLADADLTSVLANPAGWYVNVHNSAHTGGAIRGQIGPFTVPSYSTYGLVAFGVSLAAAGVIMFKKRQPALAA